MLHDITPVLLTYNEAPNLERTLAQLQWAKDIVIVDSFSDDETLTIAARYPQVRVFKRRFDQHATQWNYAVHETGIATGWVWALDADYVLSAGLVSELKTLVPPPGVVGFNTSFQYCVFGKPLRASVYPTKVTLFRPDHGRFDQDGHTQRLSITGSIAELQGMIQHDDRKSLQRWLSAQSKYMKSEAEKLQSTPRGELSAADRVRSMVVLAPFAMFVYSYVFKRNVLDGGPGLYYALQRMIAEAILSLYLLQLRLAASELADPLSSSNREEVL